MFKENYMASQVYSVLSTYRDMGASKEDLIAKAAIFAGWPDEILKDIGFITEVTAEVE